MKRLLSYLPLILLLASSAKAEWISLGGSPGQPPEITILEDGPESTTIDFQIFGYYLDTLYIESEPYSVITLPQALPFLDEGWPQLPRMSGSIIISDDEHMESRILQSEYENRHILPIAPSKGSLPKTVDPDTISYTFSDFYQTDSWWPDTLAKLHEPFILRNFRGITLQFNPFQHNAVQESLSVCKRLVVTVYPDGPGEVNVKTKSRDSISKEFSDIYANFFINYTEATWDTIAEVGRMLIIAADSFYVNMLPLVDWKMKKGIDTKLVKCSDVGVDSAAVQAYIQNEYNTDGITFILLVGDGTKENITTPTTVPYNRGLIGDARRQPSDPVYTYLEGDDKYPDAFISRFSAETSEHAVNQVVRTINYERYPQIGASWYHKGTGIASDEDGGTGTTDGERCDLLRADLLDYTYTYIDQIYDPGATASQVTAALNDGRSIVNYIGHGELDRWSTASYYNSDVFSLENSYMIPFIISAACQNGNFVNATCFAEAWLRAGSADISTGAIAFYGSSIDQRWVEPCIGQAAAVDLLTQDRMNTVGGILFNGCCKMIEQYPYMTGPDQFQTWHIFGDASVQVRTDTPESLSVSHPHFYQLGSGSFTVNAGTSDATVCLWKENEEYHQTQFTDASGQAIFNADFDNTGSLWVTVTKYNHIPYEALVISGTMANSETWPPSVFTFGDVTVSEDVTVSSDMTLIFKEGTTVEFDTTDAEAGGIDPERCELTIQGTMIADGTASEPIVFTSNAATPQTGDWYGIRFLDSSIDSACLLEHCHISYADKGIYCQDATPEISQSEIDHCTYGIYCDTGGSALLCSGQPQPSA
jgi:hypothetical protein